jgi:signal transduction histidine kinase
MADHSDELLFSWLNQRIERIARFSGAHRMLTDAVLAIVVAGVSIVGLIAQGRLSPAMLAFCVALCLPLLLRHRDPRLSFACVALAALVQWLVSGPQLADAAVLVALYWVCLECDVRAIAVSLVVVETGAILLAVGWEHVVVKYWVGVNGLVVAAAALGLIVRQRRELLASLRERAARLELERDQQAELAAVAERARIAREMHDIVSHNLTVMIALADGARYSLDAAPSQAAGAIERLAATGREALVEMRRLLGVLRDESAREPLEPQPTLERLDELISRVDAAGIPVTIELDGALDSLAPGVQLTVFRVVQEALTNTLKHAARPTSAHLEVRCRGADVEVDVTNAGSGAGVGPPAFARASDGRGLRGMRERANAYGGELEVGPTGDGGWHVRMRLHADTQAPARTLEPIL